MSQRVVFDTNTLRRVCTRVEIAGELRVVADDPDDDKFVECALVAGASMIVSGDHHLLELGQYESIRIFSAAEFVALYRLDESRAL